VAVQNTKDLVRVYLEVIHEQGGVFDISHPYAKALEKMGYHAFYRPWGRLDFVIKTQTLLELRGKKHEATRRNFRKLDAADVTVRELTPDDAELVNRLEMDWAEKKHQDNARVGNVGYASLFLQHFDVLPDSVRAKAVGSFVQDRLIGVSMGNMLSAQKWTCGYGYGDKHYPSIITWGWHQLAQHYADIPIEVDGDGGAESSGIYKHKLRHVDDDMLDKQKTSYVVKK
jgi:hypothetical protein